MHKKDILYYPASTYVEFSDLEEINKIHVFSLSVP